MEAFSFRSKFLTSFSVSPSYSTFLGGHLGGTKTYLLPSVDPLFSLEHKTVHLFLLLGICPQYLLKRNWSLDQLASQLLLLHCSNSLLRCIFLEVQKHVVIS